MSVMTSISRALGRTKLKVSAHSPEILMVTGIVSLLGSVVLAAKGTMKLEETVAESTEEIEQARAQEGTVEAVRMARVSGLVRVARLYVPAAGAAVLGVGCILQGNKILRGRNLALAAAYKALETVYDRYRENVRQEIGEDGEYELHERSTREVASVVYEPDEKGRTARIEASPYARWFDEGSNVWTKDRAYNVMTLQNTQNYMNDLLRLRGHLFLNEVYDRLGLPRSQAGCVVGWLYNADGADGDNFIDFGLFDDRRGARDFVNTYEGNILLDFNVDGPIWELI